MRKITWLGAIFGVLIVLSLFLPQEQVVVASPDIETIRPTNYYDAIGETTNPTQAYDGNTATSGDTLFGVNATDDPSINYGQDGAGNADAWQTKSQSWDSAILYATIERTGVTNDFAGVYIIDSLDTEKHTLLALGKSEFSKQEVSQTLSSADWGDSGFPDIFDLRVKVKSTLSGGSDGAYLKIYDIRIEGSYTPPIISITVTDGTVAYGTVAVGATEDTTASGVNDTQTATNNGNVAEKFQIKSFNGIGGTDWTLGSSQGDNTFTHKASTDGGNNWSIAMIEAGTYYDLAASVLAEGYQDFDLQIGMPTSITDYGEHTITVTVLATAA